jgi:hypothetical protein
VNNELFSKFNYQILLHTRYHLSEPGALYVTHTLRQFAISLIGIFLPIYIYSLSSAYLIFNQNEIINGIVWVLMYFFLRSISVLLFTLMLGNVLFTKIRFQRSIFFSLLLLVGEITLWMLAGNNLYLMLLAGFVAGLKVVLYWIPYHIYFIRKFDDKSGHFGARTGVRFFLVRLVTGLGPVAAGYIISTFGFNVLFIIGAVLIIASGFPVLLSVHEGKHRKHDVTDVIKRYYFNKRFKKLSLAFTGEGIEAVVYASVWPILLIVGLQSFVKVGVLSSVSLILSALTVLAVGKIMDKHGSKVIHGFGVAINSAIQIIKAFIIAPISLYAVDILERLNSPLYSLPNIALPYEKAKRSGDSDFIIYREIAVHNSLFLTSGILIIALSSMGVWRWVFAIAALGSLMTYFFDLDKN